MQQKIRLCALVVCRVCAMSVCRDTHTPSVHCRHATNDDRGCKPLYARVWGLSPAHPHHVADRKIRLKGCLCHGRVSRVCHGRYVPRCPRAYDHMHHQPGACFRANAPLATLRSTARNRPCSHRSWAQAMPERSQTKRPEQRGMVHARVNILYQSLNHPGSLPNNCCVVRGRRMGG
jgi:hypothetical protein